MKIAIKRDGETLVIIVNGNINTDTAPQLEAVVKGEVEKTMVEEKIAKVIFDFKEVEYISSAGLRVVMNTYKLMNKARDGVKVREANKNVKEVFHITGFDKFLTVE